MKRSLLRHLLVVAACLAGIVGMGTVFGGFMHGDMYAAARGAPFLLVGAWIAGRDLGRSMLAHRAQR